MQQRLERRGTLRESDGCDCKSRGCEDVTLAPEAPIAMVVRQHHHQHEDQAGEVQRPVPVACAAGPKQVM